MESGKDGVCLHHAICCDYPRASGTHWRHGAGCALTLTRDARQGQGASRVVGFRTAGAGTGPPSLVLYQCTAVGLHNT